MTRLISVVLGSAVILAATRAEDWPMYGRDHTHNAVSPEKGAPLDWQNETKDDNGAVQKARHIKWSAKLGSQSLGGPVIASGLVWVGTNNANPRDPRDLRDLPGGQKRPIDKSVLMCFRESDGKFLWQYASPRLNDITQDGPSHSMGSTVLIEGERLWLITNRCETVCFDIGPLRRREGLPKEVWKVDMRKDFGVYPHGHLMAMGFSPSVAADSERVFAVTGNGVDDGHINLPAPEAPSLICFDKKSGATVWKDTSPGKHILHGQRSSPLVAQIKGRAQVIAGQGDGWLRSFDAASGKLVWKCDLNPKGATHEIGGRGTRNEIMATPVVHDGRVYIAPGQDPEHHYGVSYLYCIDPTGDGDVSLQLSDGATKGKPNPKSRVVWRYGGPLIGKDAKRDFIFCRTISNATVHDGLVYATDIEGFAYCLDAKTGKLQWEHDLRASCWATPLWVDGKVYMVTEDGDVWIFAHGREKKQLAKIEMNEPIHAGPVFANGVLYVMTNGTLYAIQEKK